VKSVQLLSVEQSQQRQELIERVIGNLKSSSSPFYKYFLRQCPFNKILQTQAVSTYKLRKKMLLVNCVLVSFINILQASFWPISFGPKKDRNINWKRRKLVQHFHIKRVSKMLMKLIPSPSSLASDRKSISCLTSTTCPSSLLNDSTRKAAIHPDWWISGRELPMQNYVKFQQFFLSMIA